MNATVSSRSSLFLFATAIFASAFLLFQVQPIMGKYILPWFGGSPSVWTTCMLFFQFLLFAGYAYAHLLSRWLSVRRQVELHCGLLLLALLTLPIAPSPDWKPSGSESPVGLILLLLICKIGMPYFLLSATGPLLQSWVGLANVCAQPYRLYALSNVGSLLALISFPFLIEPFWSSPQQAANWSWGFAGFAALCGACGYRLWFMDIAKETALEASENSLETSVVSTENRIAWFYLPALASMLLLATTNQICIDIGVIPFLWVIPLAVYLLTFILTFDSSRWYSRRAFIMIAAITFLFMYAVKMARVEVGLPGELGLYLTGMFACCMVCHGEVVALKPQPRHLTSFYLTLSAGGACGGLFVGLVAPYIFTGYFEWQMSLLCCLLLFVACYLSEWPTWSRIPLAVKVSVTAVILVVSMASLGWFNSLSNQHLVATRNFYGVLSVNRTQDTQGRVVKQMVHGRIVHGSQFEAPSVEQLPTTYYSTNSGVGQLLSNFRRGQSRRIGVVGLGAGTLATYGDDLDEFRFYEINPEVVRLATEHFSFLSRSRARIETLIGDGRLTLERESPQSFDVLVLDAFSGDAIPVHLLTREAMQIYHRHLKSDGVIAFHISNLYLDLRSITAGLSDAFGYHSIVIDCDAPESSSGQLHSIWVLMSPDSRSLLEVNDRAIAVDSSQRDSDRALGKPVLWTDERSDLLQVIK